MNEGICTSLIESKVETVLYCTVSYVRRDASEAIFNSWYNIPLSVALFLPGIGHDALGASWRISQVFESLGG
jgi:hypothetical protein